MILLITNFLFTVFQNYCFRKKIYLLDRIVIKKKSRIGIRNGGTTTKLENDTMQGDPDSLYLFLLVHKIAFIYIKKT